MQNQLDTQPILKRSFDLFFSSLVLILCFPIFAFTGLLILLTSRGSIFFAHERIGKDGIPFYCYKFRTMYPDAEKRLKDILQSNPQMKEEWEKTYKLKNDPRVTSIGKFLRKTSLDELPQFWNVLKGDLSVVGPRPVVKEEIEKYYGSKAETILKVRPGITGPWQVSKRSDIESYEERVAMDEMYVRERTFTNDLLLILNTIPAMLKSKGAY